MEALVIVIDIILFILWLILLYKVWQMTNNVAEMKSYFCKPEEKKVSAFKIAARLKLLGRTEEALKIMDERLEELNLSMTKKLDEDTPAQTIQKTWGAYMKGYDKVYKYLGAELPEKYRDFNFQEYADTVKRIANG